MRLSLFTSLFCCIVKVFTIVKGRYQAEIILVQYNNTPPGKCHGCNNVVTSREQHQGCCDDPTNNGICIGDDLCDVYFTYCLRPFGSTGRGCSNYTNVTSNVENDNGSFSFPQPQEDMNVLGLPNPILLPGLSDAYMGEGVQLYIEIWDADPPNAKPDELVDILLIDHNESVGEESTTRVHSGTYGFVSMKLGITVNCIENFQGSNCSDCVPGFTGTECQTNIDDCVGVNCSGNGQCVDGVDSFNCSCDPGFNGELCQTNIDDCVGVNCSGNGECLDGVDSFTCDCSPGYTGPLCDTQASSSSLSVAGGVIGAILVVIILIVILVLVVAVALRQNKKQAATETFKMQSNGLYDVSMATKYQGLKFNSDHQLQMFKESREVPTKSAEQPQNDEWLELKRNEVYATSMAFQLPIVDDVTYEEIQN